MKEAMAEALAAATRRSRAPATARPGRRAAAWRAPRRGRRVWRPDRPRSRRRCAADIEDAQPTPRGMATVLAAMPVDAWEGRR